MEVIGDGFLWVYNDQPLRTQQECVNALDDAASYLKGLST